MFNSGKLRKAKQNWKYHFKSRDNVLTNNNPKQRKKYPTILLTQVDRMKLLTNKTEKFDVHLIPQGENYHLSFSTVSQNQIFDMLQLLIFVTNKNVLTT